MGAMSAKRLCPFPRKGRCVKSRELNVEILMNLTRQQHKILEAGAEIFADRPTSEDTAWMARQLVQATLPHSDPGDVLAWSRTNGNLVLTIKPDVEFDQKTGKHVSSGIPYGTIPRLLLFWITTEAIRLQSRRLELGNSLSDFMRELDIVPTGGRWGTITRLRQQMNCLFKARISFEYSDEKRDAWLNMDIAPKGELWWDYKNPDNACLFNSWIQLGEDFYNAIVTAPVPIDVRALKALRKSPLALDLYAWATYTVFNVNKSGKERSVSWELLHQQFGADYNRLDNFQAKAKTAFKKITVVYQNLQIEFVKGGVKILPSTTAVLPKSSKTRRALPENKTKILTQQKSFSDESRETDFITAKAYEKAKQVVQDAGTGWDIRELERQFYAYAEGKGKPVSPDKAFVGFVRKKVQKRP